MSYPELIAILDSTLRMGTPLLLACLAGLFSERAGIFDIGLEGKMLAAAMASAAVAALTGNVWIGLGAGIVASLLFALLHGLASITFRGNQLISGVALNFLASGLTVLAAQALFHQGGRTPPLTGAARFNPITLPFADQIAGIPYIGPLYSTVLSGDAILVYIALPSCRQAGGCFTKPASGYAFGRWAKIPQPSIRREFPWCGCAMLRWQLPAFYVALQGLTCPRGCRPALAKR